MMADTTMPHANTAKIPGELGLWVFIFGELCLFSTFFISFGLAYFQQPEVIRGSSADLHLGLATCNTLALLTSSLALVAAVIAARMSLYGKVVRRLAIVIGLGLAFAAMKVTEYHLTVRQGHGMDGDPFFTMYFMFTGIHLLHVTIGLVLLTWMAFRFQLVDADTPGPVLALEKVAIFWHMVDLLWIVLFALFYLVR